MKRRKVLKSLGLGLSAGLILPQFVVSCKKEAAGPEINYSGTVAIIGAGAAGLYAGDILRSKGINVVILEAGSEMGGRIKSLRNQPGIPSQSVADFPVELGAEVTFGSDSIWGKVIQNLNVPTADLTTVPNQFILDNQAKLEADWSGDADFNTVQSFISNLPNFGGTGVSVLDAAAVSERGRALLNSEVGNFYGSTSSQVGAAGLAEGLKLLIHDGKWLSMKANPLQDLLLSRFSLVTSKVLLSHPVQEILYGGDKVTINGLNLLSGSPEPYTMEFNKVIVTVPLSILKSGGISFSPALPGAMTGSMSNLGMDASIRVVLDFKKNFWGATSDRGSFSPEGNVFPSAGGSGVAGAILRGDKWSISVAGVLGGTTVTVEYSIAALVNNPGQTIENWLVKKGSISTLQTGFIWGGTSAPQIFNAGAGRSQFEQTLSITINGPKAEELSALITDTKPFQSGILGVDIVQIEMQLDHVFQHLQIVKREYEEEARGRQTLLLADDASHPMQRLLLVLA